jgi:molybdopterin/thiamine biosynthesis adenylyltransferase
VVKGIIEQHAPWTEVDVVVARPYGPNALRGVIAGTDIVLDATGSASFTAIAARVALAAGIPLVSAAIFRGGAVARVMRQSEGDTPIPERSEEGGFLTIPPGTPSTETTLETGCSAPVNRASPAHVSATASVAAQVAIDSLTGRRRFPQELIEVYTPLEEPPFDSLGRIPTA